MSAVADRYRDNAAAFTEKIEGVPDDRWSSPTPCEGWDARDVVRHVVESSSMFLGFIGRAPERRDSVDDDPLAAWSEVRDAVQETLDDPALARQEYAGMFGTSVFEESVDRFLSADLVLHGWDLARATSQDERMDPGEVALISEQLTNAPPHMKEAMRTRGAFGPELAAPAGADEQTRLLAFAGRRA
jgi:uncharacterized protein (TIGR03086 family)